MATYEQEPVAVLAPNIWGEHGPMASAVARTYSGGPWGGVPSGVQGQSPCPTFGFGCLMEAANFPTFLKFENAKKSYISVIFAKDHG